MLNTITIMGRLVRDPELRRTGSGVAVATFTLASERDFKNKDGEKETDFVDIVTYCNTAEFVGKFFAKGRMAVASGRLQMRKWTDKEGNKRTTAEVVAENVYFADSKKEAEENSLGQNYTVTEIPASTTPIFPVIEGDDKELPF